MADDYSQGPKDKKPVKVKINQQSTGDGHGHSGSSGAPPAGRRGYGGSPGQHGPSGRPKPAAGGSEAREGAVGAGLTNAAVAAAGGRTKPTAYTAPREYRGAEAPPTGDGRETPAQMAQAIEASAHRIGADPLDLATVIGYETGGTYDPWQRGPKTKWGRHRGLIQFGEPQQREYGVYKGQSFTDQMQSVEKYLVDRGYKPGMNIYDLYSTINAGGPGRYKASDVPGKNVRSHVNSMLTTRHRSRARALMNAKGVHQGEPPSPNQPQPVYPDGPPPGVEAEPDLDHRKEALDRRSDETPPPMAEEDAQAEPQASPSKPFQTILPTEVQRWKARHMYFPADQHAGRNMVRRVSVYEVDDSGPQQTIWMKGLYKEEVKFGYRAQGFGLSTVPPAESEGYAFSLAGRPDQMFFLESEHPDHRPVNKKPGESVLYDANGNKISLHSESNGGTTEILIDGSNNVTIKGAADVKIEAPTLTINADINLTGDITQTGDFNQTGIHTDTNGPHTV